MTKQMIRTIRVFDHKATPVDVSIDFTGYGHETLGEETLFFEIDQDTAVYLSLEGIESVLSAAKKLKEEYEHSHPTLDDPALQDTDATANSTNR